MRVLKLAEMKVSTNFERYYKCARVLPNSDNQIFKLTHLAKE